MPDGTEHWATVNRCKELESEQAGKWLADRKFQIYPRLPENDGTSGTWKGKDSNDHQRAYKGIRYPQHRVMQLERGNPTNN